MKIQSLLIVALVIVSLSTAQMLSAQTRDEKVRSDRETLAADESWYYDDLDVGFAAARDSGKPMMVVLRCIP